MPNVITGLSDDDIDTIWTAPQHAMTVDDGDDDASDPGGADDDATDPDDAADPDDDAADS